MLSYPFKNFVLFLESDARNQNIKRICYFALFFLVAIASAILSYKMLVRFPKANIFTVYPLFGEYIKHIVQEGQHYGICEKVTPCYAGRLPLVPYFMAAIAFIHNSIPFAFFVKNLIVCLLTISVFNIMLHNNKIKTYVLILALFCLFIPSNIVTMLDINHEEGYAWPLMLLFFSLLIYSIRYQETLLNVVIMTILLGCLVLLKSSYIYFVIAMTIYILVFFKNRINKIIPLGVTLSILLLWGIFTYSNTGYFAVLNNMSSFNGFNLYKGNTPYTLDYYPKYHIDTLEREKLSKIRPNLDFSNHEWEQNSYFNNEAKHFIFTHPLETLNLAWHKALVFFVDIRQITIKKSLVEETKGKNVINENLVKLSYPIFWLMNRIVLWSALLVSIYYAFFCKSNDFNWQRKISLAYLCIVIFYALPSIIGFALYRHVIPLIPLSTIFLIWVLLGKSRDSERHLSSDPLIKSQV